jgi:DNA-binding HxlR family transcriptional regulator
MQHKGFADMPCPIARSLERVGEWWSILILRDAFKGKSRFDQFQKSLGIAPNMLTRRLNTLVESGLLERRLYSEKPPRHEYLLTPRGQDFRPVLWALMAWGNKHFPPEGETVAVVDAKTGEQAEPVLVDSRSGRVLRSPEFTVATVPAAGSRKQREGAGVSADPKVSGDAQASGDPKVRGGPRVSGEQTIRVGAKARSAKQKRAGTSS